MPITQAVNSKANIKKFSNQDLPVNPQQPVISSTYATSTTAQTVINLSFSVDQSLTDQFFLFVDGKKLRLGSSNDYVFSAIGADNTSAQVTLNQSLPAGLNIQAYMLGLKSETEFLMDNRFTQLYDYQDNGFQSFVKSNTLMTPTTTTGTPAAGTFYSTLQNRASMIDLSQDLGARMGDNRIMTQEISLSQSEYGPNGEQVFTTSNDTFGQIRFVGTWVNNSDLNGTRPGSSGVASVDYIEVTFYGTGLNMMGVQDASARNFTVGIDGGAQGANLYVSGTGILLSRNTSANTVFAITSGLTLGVHTAKILLTGSVNQTIYGFEIVNESSSVKVNPGIGYVQGKKYTSAAQSVFAYNSVATGTKGGRVLVYQSGDGSIGKAWQAVNTSSALLTSADHTNEEVVRTFNWREFGANRADDFSTLFTTGSLRGFTLDDGTTTLVASSSQLVNVNNYEALAFSAAGNTISLTFVGCGIDLKLATASLVGVTVNYAIDGAAAATIGAISNNTSYTHKIASGLAYGTHTLRLTLSAVTSGTFGIVQFITYQPKKPALPSASVEIADYNVMANYDGTTITGTAVADNMQQATGTLLKATTRELSYTGANWAFFAIDAGAATPFAPNTATNNAQPFAYTFFGTGFVVNMGASIAGTYDFTVTIDGSLNASGVARSNASNLTGGSYRSTATGSAYQPCRIEFTGLTAGLHTISIQRSAGTGNFNLQALSLITPIHSFKPTLYEARQDVLNVGSQGISDGRKLTPVKDAIPGQKAWAQAVGVASAPTITTTTLLPMPDMYVSIKTNGGPIRISFVGIVSNNTANAQVDFSVYVDGVAVEPQTGKAIAEFAANQPMIISSVFKYQVPAGTHYVAIYWASGGVSTSTATGTQRQLLVEET